MKDEILKAIETVVESLGHKDLGVSVLLERPADMDLGDFSSNIAMALAKKAKKSPLALAIEFVDKFKESGIPGVDKVEVAGPGFINFYLSRSVVNAEISKMLEEGDTYGTLKKKTQKIAFEYTDPNPFKVFHIGHLMANTIGESLARIAETQGVAVRRFCYQGDVGRHVALTIWGLRFMTTSIPEESAPLSERVAYFGKAYALGATEYKRVEDLAKKAGQISEAGIANSPEYIKVDAEVQELNKKIYFRTDPEVNEIYDKGREWSLEHFEELYTILGTKFDRYFFESVSAIDGMKVVAENTAPKGKAVFEESNGAVIFPGEKYDLHTRVFVTRQGLPTYEGKEVGLAPLKYKAFKYDRGITVTANEQSDYFKVVNKVIGILYPELADKIAHISHGMLKLTTGKMSSRTGDVITGESLLASMIDLALEKMKERDMTEEDKKKVAEIVAVSAIKYTVLRQTVGKDIIFDPEKSLSFEGDSGPYLQYSCVRAKSVLDKAEKEGVTEVVGSGVASDDKIIHLENLLIRFPEVLARANLEQSAHVVVGYLTELAGSFNSFYANVPIVRIEDPQSPHRVAVVRAFYMIMKNGLTALGIQVPSKM